MRSPRLSVLVLPLVLAGCNLPAGSSSNTSSTASDAGTDCPENNGCSSCVQCALASPCQALYHDCLSSLACQAVDECFAGCNLDKTCQTSCLSASPNGAPLYEPLIACVTCEQCVNACAGQCL